MQATAQGTTRALEHVVNHLDEAVGQAEEFLGQCRKWLTDLHGQVDQPFEYAERLAQWSQRQQELVEALDLSKNQTGAIIDASANAQVADAGPVGLGAGATAPKTGAWDSV